MGIVSNPVMSGFYPDPSVCYVDTMDENGICKRDYYMVHSTFSYSPGLPIFHSEDLCTWELIGHVLTRKEQLDLEGASMSQGLYAPCIRYHKGMFYVTCTNVSAGGNFYVSAKDPAGEWSKPVYLPDAEGIDPSLYFEEDTCYYIGQRTKADAEYFGDCEIWLQELDLINGKLTGEISVLWDGALKHAIWPEGPHLYKKGDYYYLVIAEGGTAYSHSICVARSKNMRGPYEPSPNNPVFTHRHLGNGAEVQNVGHCDLVEKEDGDWYAFLLGTRPIDGYAPLGRETFVAEVKWQEDWPVFNPCVGMLRRFQPIGKMNLPSENRMQESEAVVKKELLTWSEPMDKRCLFFRYPEETFYTILQQENGESALALELSEHEFDDTKSPAYIGIRVPSLHFAYETTVKLKKGSRGQAGIVYLYDEKNYIALLQNEQWIELYRVEDGKKERIALHKKESEQATFSFVLNGVELQAYANEKPIGEALRVSYLTSEKKGGFVGCTMGVYATKAEPAGELQTGRNAKAMGNTEEERAFAAKEYAYFSSVKMKISPY